MKVKIHLKNFLTIFLLTLLLFNSSGYFLLYIASTHFVKKLVIKKLLNHELDHEIILLSISIKDIKNKKVSFEWIHSKEFRFNGKMYDIKNNLSDNDSLRFYCYYDDKENMLEELFCKYSNSEKESKKNINSINLLPFLNLFFSNDRKLEKFFFTGTKIFFVFFYQLTEPIIDVPTPPPQFFLV